MQYCYTTFVKAMGRYSVKRYKTKRRTRDLDLIHEDLSNKNTIEHLKHQPDDEYQPGLGQYFCIHCNRYFQSNKALATHLKGKVHKRRVKELSVNPYSSTEAEAASGLNLEKYINKVKTYNEVEPMRKEQEIGLLKDLVNENDILDTQRFELEFPELAEEKRQKKIQEEELQKKVEFNKQKRLEAKLKSYEVESETSDMELEQD